MIPIKDNLPSQTLPAVTYGLIAANLIAFFYQQSLGPAVETLIYRFGFIPALLTRQAALGPHGRMQAVSVLTAAKPMLTSLFLHGSWLHVLSNMLYLWIFGDNVEDRMGHSRYLVFYLLCGLAANGAQYYSNPAATAPILGASGAIAGVLGAYFVLYPRASILTLIPVFFIPYFLQIPAVFLLLFWFIQQFLFGLLSTGIPGPGGVAWFAHIGGFIAGMFLVGFFQRRERRPRALDLWERRRRDYRL